MTPKKQLGRLSLVGRYPLGNLPDALRGIPGASTNPEYRRSRMELATLLVLAFTAIATAGAAVATWTAARAARGAGEVARIWALLTTVPLLVPWALKGLAKSRSPTVEVRLRTICDGRSRSVTPKWPAETTKGSSSLSARAKPPGILNSPTVRVLKSSSGQLRNGRPDDHPMWPTARRPGTVGRKQ